MGETNDHPQAFIEDFDTLIAYARNLCFMTRAKELQLLCIEQLNELSQVSANIKQRAKDRQNEDLANEMLAYGCMIEAIGAELQMWVALKDDESDLAWNRLVAAQSASESASRAHEVGGRTGNNRLRLATVEKVLFPPQVFLSVGITVHYSECSICKAEYGECDHLVGVAYMGEFCIRVITQATAHEASMVENPANRNCRILNFGTGREVQDVMTWRIVQGAEASTGLVSDVRISAPYGDMNDKLHGRAMGLDVANKECE